MKILAIALFFSVAVLTAGCLPMQVADRKDATTASGTSSSTVAGSVSSVAAFQSTVFPLVTAHCANCHTGTNQPFFAGPSAQADHDALVSAGKVNLDSPAQSRLVLRLSQDMHNCWSDCATNASDMQAAIAKWATLLKAASTPTATSTTTTTTTTMAPAVRVNSIQLLIPANLPGPGETAANFTTLTWPLASAADTITPDIPGASFTVDIQKFDQYSYRLRNPKIISPSTAVYVSDVRFAINGAIRANDTTYSLVDQIVPAGSGTILSPASMITLVDKGPGVDMLSLSLVQIKASAAAGCKNLAGWTSAVKPVFTNSCVRCHSAGNSFDMVTGTDANVCARTLGRVDVNTPTNSILISYPLTGTNHPGGGGLINQTTVNSWINWITSER